MNEIRACEYEHRSGDLSEASWASSSEFLSEHQSEDLSESDHQFNDHQFNDHPGDQSEEGRSEDQSQDQSEDQLEYPSDEDEDEDESESESGSPSYKPRFNAWKDKHFDLRSAVTDPFNQYHSSRMNSNPYTESGSGSQFCKG